MKMKIVSTITGEKLDEVEGKSWQDLFANIPEQYMFDCVLLPL